MKWLREPGLVGWVAVTVVVVAADVIAARTDRRTMSAWVAAAERHPVASPVVVGTAVGLGWHLLGHPLLVHDD